MKQFNVSNLLTERTIFLARSSDDSYRGRTNSGTDDACSEFIHLILIPHRVGLA